MRFLPKRNKDKSPDELRLELLRKELNNTKKANRRKNMTKTFRSTMERVAIQPKPKSKQMEWMFGRDYTDRVIGRRK